MTVSSGVELTVEYHLQKLIEDATEESDGYSKATEAYLRGIDLASIYAEWAGEE